MSDRLQEIRDRLATATPGEWYVRTTRDTHYVGPFADCDVLVDIDGEPCVVCEHSWTDSEFIANAPDDIRWLLARLSELETECILRDHDLTRKINKARSVYVHVVERTRPPAKLHLTPDEWEDLENS